MDRDLRKRSAVHAMLKFFSGEAPLAEDERANGGTIRSSDQGFVALRVRSGLLPTSAAQPGKCATKS